MRLRTSNVRQARAEVEMFGHRLLLDERHTRSGHVQPCLSRAGRRNAGAQVLSDHVYWINDGSGIRDTSPGQNEIWRVRSAGLFSLGMKRRRNRLVSESRALPSWGPTPEGRGTAKAYWLRPHEPFELQQGNIATRQGTILIHSEGERKGKDLVKTRRDGKLKSSFFRYHRITAAVHGTECCTSRHRQCARGVHSPEILHY